MAELAAGPHAATDADERSRRQDRRQRTEATALAEGLPLYTRNPKDFDGLDDLLAIVPV